MTSPSSSFYRSLRSIVALLALCLISAAPAVFGQATAATTIVGQVSNASTRSFLEGATVTIEGTDQVAVTDREGRYTLSHVSSGPVTLVATFTGLTPLRVVVESIQGRIVRDFALTSEVYLLEAFSVAGEREGTAKAITLQRQAPNVKNVVSSDTFGSVADGNVGDLLQKLPGLTADYNGMDVRQVSIRGVSSALNSVTMDGQQLATSQSAGTGRQFEFEQTSLNHIEMIEVTKAPTPDMDGASIGGTVNLVTKSAFDRAGGRSLSFSMGLAGQRGYFGPTERWKQPIRGIGPSANFTYQDVLGANRTLGITLTGSVHSQAAGSAIIQNSYEQRNDPGPAFNYSTSRAWDNGLTRSRIATGLKVDYKLSESTTLSINSSASYFHENNDRRTHALTTIGVPSAANPQVLATVDAAGNRTGAGFIAPNYTDDFTQVFAGPNSVSAMTMLSNDKSGRTYVFAPSMRQRFPGLQLDYAVTYSNSATYYDVAHEKDKYSGRPTGTVTYRLANVGWTTDRARDRQFPTITQTQGPSMGDVANYNTLLLTQTDQRGYDRVLGAKFDAKKDIALARPTFVKAGFNLRQQNRKRWDDPRRFNYTGPDGVLGTADDAVGVAQFADIGRRITTSEEDLFGGRGVAPAQVNPYRVAAHQRDNRQLWREDVAFSTGTMRSLQLIEEKVFAGYLMGQIRLGPVSVLAGGRYELTRGEGEGPLNYISPQEAARRAAWVGIVTDDEQRRRNVAQFGGRNQNSGKYDFYLPGIHLKYEPTRNLLFRASWSTGIGRAPFGSIIPNTTVNDTAQTVTISNPELKPQYSNNYDVSAEYYFSSQGMISVGAYRKNIRDYIRTDSSEFIPAGQDNGFDGQYVGYRITTSINSGTATIEGIEFNYVQQLTFLQGWMKGLGVNANFTMQRTEGDNSSFTTGPVASAGGTIAGFLKDTGNFGLSYRGHGFDLRLMGVYRGKYLTSNNAIAALVAYQESKISWSLKSRYNWSRQFGVFLDLENLFEMPLDRVYAGYSNRSISYRTFPMKIAGGITGRF